MREPPLVVTSRVKLSQIDPADTGRLTKAEAKQERRALAKQIRRLQRLLAANADRAVVLVFQGVDASGKDGAIRKVLRGVNPAGIATTSFKQPSRDEKAHDFLWRVHRAVPAYGMLGVFNRSHYEAVLAERVLDGLSRAEVRRRFRQIVDFERMLADNRVVVLKFFLHLSRREQAKRIEARRKRPSKRWKFSAEDVENQRHWNAYAKAYEEMVNATSHARARWHVIPADHKWYRNYLVAHVLVQALTALKMKWPGAERKRGTPKTVAR